MITKLMRPRTLTGFIVVAAIVSTTAACGDVVRTSRAPVILSVAQLAPTLLNSSVSGGSDETGTATLAVDVKDVTFTSPTSNNAVMITQYQVVYRRTDGRNTPGIDVPYPFSGPTTTRIDPNSTGSVTFELVRQVAKQESPLVQITDANVVAMIADVTFFGHDLVGNDLNATGSLMINFRK
jgi:hypothetical protein